MCGPHALTRTRMHKGGGLWLTKDVETRFETNYQRWWAFAFSIPRSSFDSLSKLVYQKMFLDIGLLVDRIHKACNSKRMINIKEFLKFMYIRGWLIKCFKVCQSCNLEIWFDDTRSKDIGECKDFKDWCL